MPRSLTHHPHGDLLVVDLPARLPAKQVELPSGAVRCEFDVDQVTVQGEPGRDLVDALEISFGGVEAEATLNGAVPWPAVADCLGMGRRYRRTSRHGRRHLAWLR